VTYPEFILSIMEEMGVYNSGQTVEAEDEQTITRRVGPKLAELNKRGVCYVQDINDIDDELALPLVKIMAAECASAFNLDVNKTQILMATGGFDGQAETILRQVTSLRRTGQTLRQDRFYRPRRWWYRY